MLKQFRSDMKSLVSALDRLSKWMLKSPRRMTVGDIAQMVVSRDENSSRKEAEGLGGL